MKIATLLNGLLFLLSGFVYAQQTYVPDDNFENYLETHDTQGNTVQLGDSNSMGNGIANDDYVLTSRISNVSALNVDGQNIHDLTGIEDFQNLQFLSFFSNPLTNLDLTQNTALQEIWFANTPLTNIDVSHNIALQKLYCDNNHLTSLDLTQNAALQQLSCSSNQLTSLNLPQNSVLQMVICEFNELTSIDLSQSTSLQSIVCNYNHLTSLDLSHNTILEKLYCHDNQLTGLDLTHNTALQELYCYVNQITDLDLSQNIALQKLYCYYNQLTSLNLKNGNNSNLAYFSATYNPDLTCVFVDDTSYMENHWANAIDASAAYVENQAECNAFLDLTYVPDDNFEAYLENNGMGNGINGDDFVTTTNIRHVTTLNVSNLNIADLTGIEDFQDLQILDCSDNQLTSLDISHNMALQNLRCHINQLNSLITTQNPDLQILWCNNNQLNSLNVTQNTSLQKLSCGNNQLTNLDVTQNPALEDFYCNNNQLIYLDVSQNTALQKLDCSENQLTSLDISQNTALQDLGCSSNHLTSINITHNTALTGVGCHDNQLTGLVATQNTLLRYVECYNNQITSLDFTQNHDLVWLLCQNNRLTNLDIRNGNNANFWYFDAIDNPDLACVFVDDKVLMTNNWANAIDPTATYVETQAECDALSLADEIAQTLVKIYPNPVSNILNISSDKDATIIIINMAGQQVIKTKLIGKNNMSIPVENLQTGIYLLVFKTPSDIYHYQFVKK